MPGDGALSVAERRALDATRSTAATLADAAATWLDSLNDDQRAIANFAAPDARSDSERLLWFYTPTDHGGLTLNDQRPAQQRLVFELLASGLSEAGYVTVVTVMSVDNLLDRLEGWTTTFDRERGRDPGMYYLSIFGAPGGDVWGWRFGGHHISINQLIVDGRVVSTTPFFLGADPASAPLLGSSLRPHAGVQDGAYDLLASLSPAQRRLAVIHPRAVSDIVGGNRSSLSDGDGRIAVPKLFRSPLADPATNDALAQLDAAMVSTSSYSEADDDRVAYSTTPKGIAARRLTSSQRARLAELVNLYFDRAAKPIADVYRARYLGSAALDSLHLAWAGPIARGEPHYYRIQGPGVLLEYDNTQRAANHVHAVWRDPANDFGLDVLRRHRNHVPHQNPSISPTGELQP